SDPGHPEPLHDFGVACPRVDEDGLLAAKDQEPECGNARPDPHVAAEHEEARLDVGVDEAQKLDLQGHGHPFGTRSRPATLVYASFRGRVNANRIQPVEKRHTLLETPRPALGVTCGGEDDLLAWVA